MFSKEDDIVSRISGGHFGKIIENIFDYKYEMFYTGRNESSNETVIFHIWIHDKLIIINLM